MDFRYKLTLFNRNNQIKQGKDHILAKTKIFQGLIVLLAQQYLLHDCFLPVIVSHL